MKKLFFMLLAGCSLVACDPVQEEINNPGHISLEELRAKTTVSVDKAESGANGNQITCQTTAPVNAIWTIGGKRFAANNYAYKKMKVGTHEVCLEALCPDGTVLYDTTEVTCDVITNELQKFYIFGDKGEAPVVMDQGDAAAGRFSDNEGKGLPYIKDEVYLGKKTLVFKIDEAAPADAGIWGEPAGPVMVRIMNGWWAATYADEVLIESAGLWELPITDAIAKDCARAEGCDGKDLTILVRRGKLVVSEVYYEE